jgi:hypothetical protein
LVARHALVSSLRCAAIFIACLMGLVVWDAVAGVGSAPVHRADAWAFAYTYETEVQP